MVNDGIADFSIWFCAMITVHGFAVHSNMIYTK